MLRPGVWDSDSYLLCSQQPTLAKSDDEGAMDKDTEEGDEDEGQGLPKEGTDSNGLIEVVTSTTQIWGLRLTCNTWNIDMLQFLRLKSEIQSL